MVNAEFARIAPDVKLGKDVKVYAFVMDAKLAMKAKLELLLRSRKAPGLESV